MGGLVRKLLTHDINLQEEQGETSDRRVAIKSTVTDPKCQGDSQAEASEDEIVMLGQGVHKMLKNKNFDFERLQRRSSSK